MHYDYSFGNLELFSTSAAWTSAIREETLEMIDIPETSESATKNGWVTLLVIISLFCISVGTLAFGTIKVAEGASKLDQPIASTQVGGWHHLK